MPLGRTGGKGAYCALGTEPLGWAMYVPGGSAPLNASDAQAVGLLLKDQPSNLLDT
jgi:hypothetical protein